MMRESPLSARGPLAHPAARRTREVRGGEVPKLCVRAPRAGAVGARRHQPQHLDTPIARPHSGRTACTGKGRGVGGSPMLWLACSTRSSTGLRMEEKP